MSTDDGVLDGYEIYNGDTRIGEIKETTYTVTQTSHDKKAT